MKKIEAKTLEEAYAKAAESFECSVTDLEYEIIQHPSRGFLGFGSRQAIIVAVCKTKTPTHTQRKTTPPPRSSSVATASSSPDHTEKKPHPRPSTPKATTLAAKEKSTPTPHSSETDILNGFFDDPSASTSQTHGARKEENKPAYSEQELGQTLEAKLGELMRSACFDIDTVEVDVIDGTAYVFVDGEDAALLIGKEGYRYNALSYLLYNWLHNEYGLFVKLEIAQFLASQQEMIRNYIQPVIEHVQQNGWGKTRPLDGILVQIALEQLREEFPNKYVAIKRTRNGERYILINEFNKRT